MINFVAVLLLFAAAKELNLKPQAQSPTDQSVRKLETSTLCEAKSGKYSIHNPADEEKCTIGGGKVKAVGAGVEVNFQNVKNLPVPGATSDFHKRVNSNLQDDKIRSNIHYDPVSEKVRGQ